MFKVATVTGSEKSPPGGETAPTIDTEPVLSAKYDLSMFFINQIKLLKKVFVLELLKKEK
jgi:hypothetical protein